MRLALKLATGAGKHSYGNDIAWRKPLTRCAAREQALHAQSFSWSRRLTIKRPIAYCNPTTR
jgi:hypothetical protein